MQKPPANVIGAHFEQRQRGLLAVELATLPTLPTRAAGRLSLGLVVPLETCAHSPVPSMLDQL